MHVHALVNTRDTLGETPQLFGAVAAIGAFHFMRAELGPATEAIAEMRRHTSASSGAA